MLTINYKQIYETSESGDKQWILILYDISANHYVGVPVYSKETFHRIYRREESYSGRTGSLTYRIGSNTSEFYLETT